MRTGFVTARPDLGHVSTSVGAVSTPSSVGYVEPPITVEGPSVAEVLRTLVAAIEVRAQGAEYVADDYERQWDIAVAAQNEPRARAARRQRDLWATDAHVKRECIAVIKSIAKQSGVEL